ncbi:MAG TPA: lipopolysaccharide heptosyltransferase I [Pelomicrobium sp.]|nr:lipopolysaccharide heptosyltransferase I [Pelomicrobium sp.]
MTASRFLLVKTSSMGDVIHNLPVASDLARAHPGCAIDWIVEEGFADVPRLHPAVRHVIPVAVRRWRRAPASGATWREIRELRSTLGAESYDLVIDTQGLVKSALLARLAVGLRCGYDRASAREPLASLFYGRRCAVDRALHAVERNRRLAACCAGYAMAGGADYGIEAPERRFDWLPAGSYAVLLTATSRDDKLWPEGRWIDLGRALAERGLTSVLPAGSRVERERSERLAQAIPGAVAAPSLTLADLASLLAGSVAVAGVDTGLTHLAAALGRPVVGIYCATEPGLTGVHAAQAVNLGAAGRPPTAEDVLAALQAMLG